MPPGRSYPLLVGGLERLRGLAPDRDHLRDGQGPVMDQLFEVSSFDELHGDVDDAFGFADFVDGRDVGMGHRGRELAFSQEALLRGIAVQEVAGEDFERDGASQEQISRFENDAHSAEPIRSVSSK